MLDFSIGAFNDALKGLSDSDLQAKDKIKKLMELMVKAKEISKKDNSEKDCLDNEEDCREILSPCCKTKFKTVFGTLPLKVICLNCGNSYVLREVLEKSIKKSA